VSKDPAGPPQVSVIVAAFSMERWDHLRAAVASVLAQTAQVPETIVVIDHNPDLLDRAQRELRGVTVIPSTSRKGVSGARNSGVAASSGEVLGFLDDDAVASPAWLDVLLPRLADRHVVGAGARVVPLWEGSRPRWLPPEFDWTVGGSYRGLPEEATAVRNVWTCGMLIPRQVFDAAGGFREAFGKVGGVSRPEDTDLCLRAAATRPEGTWVYDPAAVVSHRVPATRTTVRFFLRRCLLEGLGKAALASLNGGRESTSAEWRYTRRVLPRGVVRGLADTARGDPSGALRTAAIVAGLPVAAAGFLAGRLAGPAGRLDPAPPRAPRILVDQSGYDLLNLGDVAMLQSCVTRLRCLWPGAEIMVICHSPERLATYCPGTLAIGLGHAQLRPLPRRPRLAAEQAWKIAAPYLCGRFGARRGRPGRPRTVIQAVYAADLVVASGGGYLTDTWWWHAAGVLSVLSLAQRLGKPTAMLGQGIGPIGLPALRAQARGVLPNAAILGLREAQSSRDLALSLGARPDAITVTGDDALEMVPGVAGADGDALGLSLRVSRYAGVDMAVAKVVGDLTMRAARAFGAPVVALPVSRYPVDGDMDALRVALHPEDTGIALNDLAAPAALVAASGRCRVIVTGSYHAAVFGLAQGVPAVCLTRSSYYDAKFAGLSGLFPGACFVVSLDAPASAPDLADRLRRAIDQAWHLPAAERAAARNAADRQRQAGRHAYARIRDAVEGKQQELVR
jgi:polysaccharide pyruvyl transferase WcaK-like protein/GT2 family glycosyltransferase